MAATNTNAEKPGRAATRKTSDLGPTGQCVAANIARLRTARGLSTYRLSEVLADLDRHITPSAITRIEGGARRVDVDDLIAFAVALKVSPITLLLPPAAKGKASITGAGEVPLPVAWEWAAAVAPLSLPADDDGEVWNDFQTYARPSGMRQYRRTGE